MKKLLFMMVAVVLLHSVHLSTDKCRADETFGIKVKGYVKTDVMFDSRQTVAAREGHFLLYPAGEDPDLNGDDANARANLNMLAIQTRLTGTITGPDVGSAKTSGTIEGAFFGHSNSDVNGFRLRHAFMKLAWEQSSLLIGQYWHPMFITECFPGVVSFNTGSPIQPFSRNPQIRYTHKINDFQISTTAASQRDFTSYGPAGSGSTYLRNSAIPILNVTLKYITPGFTTGIGANYISLTPRLKTPAGYKTDEKVSSIAAMGFAKFVKDKLTLKAETIYGSNLADLLMLGGYAVKNTDQSTGAETYTDINVMSSWGEIIYGNTLQYGLFFGYTENLGADDPITGNYYARGSNIASVMRVAPRIQITKGKVQFAGEVEYTVAEYGTADSKGKVKETSSVSNLRVLFASYLFF
jgi:hypothetical protein